MRVWVDLSNSPHVALFRPIVEHLRAAGDDVVLSARDHAQTVSLAERQWPDVVVVGGASPPSRIGKAGAIAGRAAALRRLAARERFDVAISHGSYAQIVAARSLGLPTLTMMDYEFQPANHLSFRLAHRVLVPGPFPDEALRRFGAGDKARRYVGFKEELYLAGFEPDPAVLAPLGLDPENVIVVLRPPPDGALYHNVHNVRFDDVARRVAAQPQVQAVLLARTENRDYWVGRVPGAIVPADPVDGPSLVALADLTIGAGGTMNRESALLGTPTYTVFAGRLAAVDAVLIRDGRLVDLREPESAPRIEKKPRAAEPAVPSNRRGEILAAIDRALAEITMRKRARRAEAHAPGLPRRPHPARRRW